VALWPERNISDSSVERVIARDATVALDFALTRLTRLIDRLVRLSRAHARKPQIPWRACRLAAGLAGADQAGISREDAYAAVQRRAMAAWRGNGRCADLSKQDREIGRYLDPRMIDGLFDSAYHLRHVDTIFRRVFSE
jgi:adenylosuccinate lyase